MKITRRKPVKRPVFVKHGKLPGKPSVLIKLALDDLRRAEKSRKFTVDMYNWVVAGDPSMNVGMDRCTVCLAGSVMVGTLKLNIDKAVPGREATPSADFPNEQSALHAIDNLRQGSLATAFGNLDLDFPDHFLEDVDVDGYDDNPGKFKRQMSQLAKALEKEGY